MFEMLFALALLTVGDPPGDALGDGSLQPPTASVYRTLSPFDIHSVTVEDAEQLTVVIEMGSLANPFDLPLGFSMPVIEVYLEGAAGTGVELLPGSRMRLPDGRSWETAIRLTGEEAEGYRSTDAGLETVPAEVEVDGSQLIVTLPFDAPERRPRIYAITGLYDLFGSTPWRPLSQVESPWAFSSTASQSVPVVDVLAVDAAAQRQALDTGVVPPAGGRRLADGSIWLILMALGLSLALVGIALRVLARQSPRHGQTSREAYAAGEEASRDGLQDDPDDVWEFRSREPDEADHDREKRQPSIWSDANLRSEEDGDGRAPAEPTEGQRESDDWLGTSTPPPGGRVRLPPLGAPHGSFGDKAADKRVGEGARTESSKEDQEPEGERKELKRFLWDSSALLTDLDDALSTGEDELAGEFGSPGSDSNRSRSARNDSSRAVWNRPVPLPYEETPARVDENSDEDADGAPNVDADEAPYEDADEAVLLTDDEDGRAESWPDRERD